LSFFLENEQTIQKPKENKQTKKKTKEKGQTRQ
jgi:hypothetical protein